METEPDSIYYLLDLLTILLYTTPSVEISFGIVAILFLLLGSALISGSEVAYFSLSSNHLDELKQEGDNSGVRIMELREKPRKLLATILITNNFINIAIVIVSEFVIRKAFPENTFNDWSKSMIENPLFPFSITATKLSGYLQFLITVVCVTFLLVLFGEVAPKIYANLNNIKLAKLMSRPLAALMRIFGGISNILIRWTNLIEKRLEKTAKNGNITSREDIGEAIDLTVSNELNNEQEVDILKRIVKFGDVSVKQIMRSRVDVVAVDFRLPQQEVMEIVRQSKYSRIPVYENDFDNVTGILYVKDLLKNLYSNEKFEWQELIRTDVLYVPEAKKIDDLLKEFQQKHLHMAIVVDEYGGSAGIVTLEDILEEIIGEIKDEFDVERELIYRKIDYRNYAFEGKTLINDVYKVLSLDEDIFEPIRGDADSLAGLVLELIGEMPKIGTVVEYSKFKFKVNAVGKRRIKEIQVTIPQKELANELETQKIP